MDKAKVKEILIGVIAVAMGVMLLVSMSFPLVKLSNQLVYGLGFNPLLSYIKDSGFSFLQFKSNIPLTNLEGDYIPFIFGLLSIILLIFSIATIVVGITSLFVKKTEFKKIVGKFVVAGFLFSLLYTAEGIIYSVLLDSAYKEIVAIATNGTVFDTITGAGNSALPSGLLGDLLGLKSAFYGTSSILNDIAGYESSAELYVYLFGSTPNITIFTTSSWLSLLLCGIVFIGYVSCNNCIKEDDVRNELKKDSNPLKNVKAVASLPNTNEENAGKQAGDVDLAKMYKRYLELYGSAKKDEE